MDRSDRAMERFAEMGRKAFWKEMRRVMPGVFAAKVPIWVKSEVRSFAEEASRAVQHWAFEVLNRKAPKLPPLPVFEIVETKHFTRRYQVPAETLEAALQKFAHGYHDPLLGKADYTHVEAVPLSPLPGADGGAR